jgi:hypothetical protein
MCGAIHPLPKYAFMAWCLFKAQGKLYIYLYLYHRVGALFFYLKMETDPASEKSYIFFVQVKSAYNKNTLNNLFVKGVRSTNSETELKVIKVET